MILYIRIRYGSSIEAIRILESEYRCVFVKGTGLYCKLLPQGNATISYVSVQYRYHIGTVYAS